MIDYIEKDGIFHLQTLHSSYVIQLYQGMYPMHVFWGGRVRSGSLGWYLETPYRRRERILSGAAGTAQFTREYWPFEYPCYGTSDFRPPAFQIRNPAGNTATDFRFQKYRILDGKPSLDGLPALYTENDSEAQTLELELGDENTGLRLILVYTVMERYDVITRHVRFIGGTEPHQLEAALSMSLDFKCSPDRMLQLSGTALRERHMVFRDLDYGTTSIESSRGISSHQQNPFLALTNRDTTETSGEAYGIQLVYSGSFRASVHLDMYRSARVQIGINPLNFSWELRPHETFTTPEAVLVYSEQGLGGMSRRFHRVYRERLCRGIYRDLPRPVLFNTWEAAYFAIDRSTVLRYGEIARKVGIELLVVDDGWFGHRTDDSSSLGDWKVNDAKFPGGFAALSEDLKSLGLKLGIWVEPEMVSPNSELYREHPDWCIHLPGRIRTEWRNQLVLDLTRKEVTDYIIRQLSSLFHSADIAYVKWDCNRRLTECGSAHLGNTRQGEFHHRYVLGLYHILETLTTQFPHILFENCASGGGRFDPGMLYYFPQTWASDNSDGLARLKIQYGTSLCYPNISITSHVSDVPNEQLGRITPLSFREHCCGAFNLGYEWNFANLSGNELAQTKAYIDAYRTWEPLVRCGDFYRLKSPFEGPETAWMLVSSGREQAVVWYFKAWAEGEEAYLRLRLDGLDTSFDYMCIENGCIYGGDALMRVGLTVPWRNGDFFSCMWHLKKV